MSSLIQHDNEDIIEMPQGTALHNHISKEQFIKNKRYDGLIMAQPTYCATSQIINATFNLVNNQTYISIYHSIISANTVKYKEVSVIVGKL